MENKKNITKQNITEWLHSVGYFLPRNNLELERFERLYRDFDFELKEELIDPLNIINSLDKPKSIIRNLKSENKLTSNQWSNEWKLAARNEGKIDITILEKMKNNQNKAKDEDNQD